MVGVAFVTMFPCASSTATCTAGAIGLPAVVVLGCTVKASNDGGPTPVGWLLEQLFNAAVQSTKPSWKRRATINLLHIRERLTCGYRASWFDDAWSLAQVLSA